MNRWQRNKVISHYWHMWALASRQYRELKAMRARGVRTMEECRPKCTVDQLGNVFPINQGTDSVN